MYCWCKTKPTCIEMPKIPLTQPTFSTNVNTTGKPKTKPRVNIPTTLR